LNPPNIMPRRYDALTPLVQIHSGNGHDPAGKWTSTTVLCQGTNHEPALRWSKGAARTSLQLEQLAFDAGKRRAKSVNGQGSRVVRFRIQSTESGREVFSADFFCLSDGLIRDHLGQQRTASDGGNASFSAEAGFGDVAAIDCQREAQYITADGIFQLRRSGGRRQIARITGMLEVIEELGRIHRC